MVTAATTPRRLCGLDRESYIRASERIALARVMNSWRNTPAPYSGKWMQKCNEATTLAREEAAREFDQKAH